MDSIFMVMDYVEHDLKSLMELLKSKKQFFVPGMSRQYLFIRISFAEPEISFVQVKSNVWWYNYFALSHICMTIGFFIGTWKRRTSSWAILASWKWVTLVSPASMALPSSHIPRSSWRSGIVLLSFFLAPKSILRPSMCGLSAVSSVQLSIFYWSVRLF